MLKEQDIKERCYPITYNKGKELFRRHKILSFDYSVRGNLDCIDALVSGSGYKSYQVRVDYNIERDSFETVSCECPAFHSYEGICKHVVAVLLEYVNNSNEESDIQEPLYTKEFYDQMLRSYEVMEKAERIIHDNRREDRSRARTHPEIRDLFTQQSTPHFTPMLHGMAYGEIHLEMVIRVENQQILLELKVGKNRMYVVKDIFEFYHHLRKGEDYAYGKGLQFIHTRGAFEASSRKLVDSIYHLIEARVYKRSHLTGQQRGIPVEVDELVELINLSQSESMTVMMSGYEKVYRVMHQDVPREMVIKGKDSGLEIEVAPRMEFIGGHYAICFYEAGIYIPSLETIEDIREFILAVGRDGQQHFFVAEEDVTGFVRYLLPKLDKHYSIEYVDYDVEVHGIEPVTFRFYLDAPTKERIQCKAVAVYGEKELSLFEPTNADCRDKVAEDQVNASVSAYFTDYDVLTKELYIEGSEERLYQFLTEGLREIEAYGEVYLTDKVKQFNVVNKVPVNVGVSIESDLLELSVSSEVLDRWQLQDLLDHYNPRKKYYRLQDGQFVTMDSGNLQQLYELKEGLGLSSEELMKEHVLLPKYRALFVDAAMKGDSQFAALRNQTFKSLVREMTAAFDNDMEVPSTLQATLRSYQEDGFRWIKALKQHGFGGILADDMGLGKTIQVISFLLSEQEAGGVGKSLIICPSSLVYNWASECERFAPALKVTMVIGTPKERRQCIDKGEDGEILITSYELLKRDIKYYRPHRYAHQIIDEGQYIKNHNTQVAKAVKAIDSTFRLALTGTPIENRLSELWSLFDFLMPGFLYTYRQFKQDFETPIVSLDEKKVAMRLKQMISPFVLRRLKQEVLKDLPDKIEENIIVDMFPRQKELYNAHVVQLRESLARQTRQEFNAGKMKVFAALTRLRQLCCDPSLIYDNYEGASAKVAMCMELIQEAVSGGHKILLFSQFTSLFPILQDRMDKEKISYMTLTGKTSKAKRAVLVKQFNEDATSVFCISLKAGGTGLNLTAADIVIHFDPWWNLAVMNQATDRAHRIGQAQVVNVYNLIARGTIEEKIISLQEAKRQLADAMLSGEGVKLASFDQDALMEILQEP